MKPERLKEIYGDKYKVGEAFFPTFYDVYCLIRDSRPIYIGVTTNIEKRIKDHKSSGKKFDSYKIIYFTENKRLALEAEKSAINAINLFFDILNKASVTTKKI